MRNEKYRYFIELQTEETSLPRLRENAVRRMLAENFVGHLREWLANRGLSAKVSALSPTAFGQIQITCEPDVIKLIREKDVTKIAAIRHGALFGQQGVTIL